MMNAFLLVLIALSVAIPSRLVAATLPAIWIGQRLLPANLQTLVPLGPVDLSPADLVVLSLLARLAFSFAARKELAIDRGLYLALAAYLAVNLVATFVAGIKFGEAHLIRCATSGARFISELLVLPIIAQAVRTLPEAKLCLRILLATLGALAAIQFLNYFGAAHGIVIGEVQGAERGELRYFGPVGDSVGMVLLLGYLVSLCFANLAGAAIFLVGILLTAGLGATFAAVVATALFVCFGSRTVQVREFGSRKLWLLPAGALLVLIAAFVVARPLTKTLVDRLRSGTYASSSAQRAVSARLAGAMIVDHPLLGVGYLGYENALRKYGGAKYFNLEKPDGAQANANNQILQSLTDSGICGLLAFAGLVACAGRLFWRVARRSADPFVATFFLAALLWLLAQFFGNLAAVWLNPGSFVARLLWIMLGLGVAVARLLPAQELAVARRSAEPELVPA